MYEMIWRKFDLLSERLNDLITKLHLVYFGKGNGNILLWCGGKNESMNTLATFDSLGHLHHILTVFLASSYDNIVLHELDDQLERQETR